ncbi:metallophosphoesterase family protein [Nakamurella alba]|uniref:metallophosphoesterase family protein n=1 Tax=Nakamurella alba TaxID=2665158 RepID=UPI002AC36B8B|nr:metallophosphoesterase family protein [Nakamurella alba]
MPGTFFTSDLHLGHRLVAGLRGFDDPADHDDEIARRWRETVGDGDTVWVLGDLAVTSSAIGIERTLQRIAGLPGTKHLVPGNHDPVHPMHRHAHRHQRRYLEVFESVQAFARTRIPVLPDVRATPMMLSHFPYLADHSDPPRFLEYRLRDEGEWLLHGHTHAAGQRTSVREIHVGLDAWDLRPAALEQVAALLAGAAS